uniref:Uncharacterized protein n=1 Tax=Panagrolaimus superbus TaxID=310955 RepID=A0A914Z694_9BILA
MAEHPYPFYRHRVETPSSAGSSSTLDWSENATLRTKFSSSDEFEYPSSYVPTPGSNYAWETNQIRPIRSLSTLSVMTAEPIDYDCSKEVDFKPSVENFSQYSTSFSLSSTASDAPLTPTQLLPGNSNIPTGDQKSRFALADLVAVESVIHQIRSQKDPPSFYHFMELNAGPIDMVPRLSNVPSQYQLQDMYEFSALQSSDAMAKLHERARAKNAIHYDNAGGDAQPFTTLHKIDSQYYDTEA